MNWVCHACGVKNVWWRNLYFLCRHPQKGFGR